MTRLAFWLPWCCVALAIVLWLLHQPYGARPFIAVSSLLLWVVLTPALVLRDPRVILRH